MDSVFDSWSAFEYPLLVAIAKRAEQSDAYMQVMSDNVLEEVVTSDKADERYKFERALVRLSQNDYINAQHPMWGKPYPMRITGITERGLRAVGAWPSPDSVVDALLQQLEERGGYRAYKKEIQELEAGPIKINRLTTTIVERKPKEPD